MASFTSLNLSPELLAVVKELGFEHMTPIQEKSIPLLLKGADLVGQSKTGSGKTAAFALPILQKIYIEKRVIQAMVLCPTRELCAQVAREMRKLARRFNGLQILTLSGGEPIRPQMEAIERGVHIIVGTPGRLLDHIARGNLNLSYLEVLVLDEADRMLDMGFEEDMKNIIEETPATRQTVFFSATFPPTIGNLSRKYQQKPEHVRIEDAPETEVAIKHFVLAAEQNEKQQMLLRLLKSSQGSVLVFCNLKVSISELVEKLTNQDLACAALHGDLEQRDRDRVLAMFRNGSVRVLIATDVAARGLDIKDLDMVVNYDVPHEAAVYTHRTGRTGRAGQSGIAISLGSMDERRRLREFETANGITIEMSDVHKFKPKTIENAAPTGAMQTLYIAGGRKDKLRPGDILGALTGEAGGLESSQIGKIEIHDNFAYVAISKHLANAAATRLKSGKIKGRKFLVRVIEPVRTP